MTFKKWLTAFFEEKDLLHKPLLVSHAGQAHIMDIPFMIEFLSTLPKRQKARIKYMFIMNDIQHENPMQMMEILAKMYLETTFSSCI